MQILFKAGVHPEAPANTLDRDAFDRVWRYSVLLLQRGFKTGSILTVDPEEAQQLGGRTPHHPFPLLWQQALRQPSCSPHQ
jgi:formamidopyrimidine-DNA glycosylase